MATKKPKSKKHLLDTPKPGSFACTLCEAIAYHIKEGEPEYKAMVPEKLQGTKLTKEQKIQFAYDWAYYKTDNWKVDEPK